LRARFQDSFTKVEYLALVVRFSPEWAKGRAVPAPYWVDLLRTDRT
jgi:hypothetical protein